MNSDQIEARLRDAEESADLARAFFLVISGARLSNPEKVQMLIRGLNTALEGLDIIDRSFIALTLFSLCAGALIGHLKRPEKMPDEIWALVERAQRTIANNVAPNNGTDKQN